MLKKLLYVVIIFCASLKGQTMKLTSPAFAHNGAIPAQYTCDGANISPALEWSEAPQNSNSFVLIVDDPDAPTKVWTHWIVFNIPNTTQSLAENTAYSAQGSEGQASGPFMQGATDFNGKRQWGGPCPPSGTHHYHFTLYALDNFLDLPTGATKEQVLQAMRGHILAQTTLIGTYQRKKQ
jgi:Raf kinase inhibitor-like YbhB/YbcL family protein